MAQEARIVALKCPAAPSYVHQAIRNRFAELFAQSRRVSRSAQDSWGRRIPLVRVDGDEASLPDWFRQSPAADAQRRELVGRLYEGLPRDDWNLLVEAFVDGAHWARGVGSRHYSKRVRLRLARAQAASLLSRICNLDEEGEMAGTGLLAQTYCDTNYDDLSPCHAKAPDPIGYDAEDQHCHQCADKFSCLPAALDDGLIDGGIHQDSEVAAVIEGKDKAAKIRAFDAALTRMRTRQNLLDQGKVIPANLLTRRAKPEIAPEPEPAPAPEPAPEPKPEETAQKPQRKKPLKRPSKKAASSTPAAKQHAAKKAAPAKRKKRPPIRTPEGYIVKGAKTRPTSAKKTDGPRATMSNGKPLPPIRQLTPEQMKQALERVRIGQPFDLKVGMQIVRRRRGKKGGEVVVHLRKNGFEVDGTVYSSLSTAAMYVERRVVSANAWFHLENHKCTEIRDENGVPIAGFLARHHV